jgi:hypothetical protein
MNDFYHPLKAGDRCDYREHRNGEVRRVGRGTIWAVFRLANGSDYPVCGPLEEFKRHVAHLELQVGEFVIRRPGTRVGLVQLHSRGEMLETDEARLASWLAKFWNREF